MTDAKRCPKCGDVLSQDAPVGICPKCLLAAGLDSVGDDAFDSSATVSAADASPPLPTVRYVGDYELLEEIARGGMGVVYKGRQVSLNRIVAIKMILSGELATQSDIERFHIEARAAANLKHSNIVAIHEVGEHEGRYYFSMDYVAGQTLADIIQNGPLPARKAAQYAETIAEAIHFAHQQGTLHRDLKPQNLLIDSDDQPQITDFGLAKRVAHDSGLTATGAVMGTPSYMPPEQALGKQEELAPHSDVYSLGAVLYEMLTGRPPFCAASAVDTLRQVIDNPPVPLRKLNSDVPQDLETICLKCLEKSPQARYQSAGELAEDLACFLNHEPIQARPASAVRKVEAWVRNRPWAITAAASLVVLLLACTVYLQFQQNLLLQYQRSHPEFVRQAGYRMERLDTSVTVSVQFGFLVVFLGHLVYRHKSLRLTHWRQYFDSTLLPRIEPRPVSTTVRLVCGAMGLSVLVFAVFLAGMIIETYVWEGLPSPWTYVSITYLLSWCALWLLLQVGQDYRHAVYGRPSRQIDPEQLAAMRTLLMDGGVIEAIRVYRTAFPDAGLDEAKRFVTRLTVQVEAEDPERYAAGQVRPWDLNWRASGKCLIVEAILVLAVWWLMQPMQLHSGLMAASFFGGWVFGSGLLFSMLFKNIRTQMLVFCPVAFLGVAIMVIAKSHFAEPADLQAPVVWLWFFGCFSGVALIASAKTPARRITAQ
ncbi:MAG: serine/threonine-protein kinase [Planctomycetaceae bacterium]